MRKLILTALFVMVSLVKSCNIPVEKLKSNIQQKSVKKLKSSFEDKDIAIRIAYTESSTHYEDAEKVLKTIFNRKKLWKYSSIREVCLANKQFSGLYNHNFYNVPRNTYDTLSIIYDKIHNGLDTLSNKIVYFNNPARCGYQSYVGKLVYISTNNHHFYEKK